jgi:probable non-F420 flavinoid oxidoreductase
MVKIAYQASQEQFTPAHLLNLVRAAEAAGFDAIHSSDHFYPWSRRQGQSGFTLAWMGAAMQVTSLPFSMVCAPGQRYHPAIVAQAAATLAQLFPGRFSMNLGSGEAINESVTGAPWPAKDVRNKRLGECADIIRRMLDGEEVTHRGLVQVEHARLYTLPDVKPRFFGAALSKETARYLGSWADGLVTVNAPEDKLREIIQAFEEGGGYGKPIHLKMDISYAATDGAALHGAYDQWRTNIFPGSILGNIDSVAAFDELAEMVQPQDMHASVLCSSHPGHFIERIKEAAALGFEQIILHNVNRDQETFIKVFCREVLPALR